MRIPQGASDAQVIEQMSTKQRRALDRATKAFADRETRERELTNRTRREVLAAFEAGVPARVLATQLDLSVGRIYQIREEGLALRAAVDTKGRENVPA